ncbi:MAG: class I SAM-dependent methyltransferase [Acidiferrobacteraceae bacterium]
MIGQIKTYLRQQQYVPGLLGLFVNPFYHSRRGLHSAIRDMAPRMSGCILDIGCGRKPYRDLFRVNEYVGLELDTPENRTHKSADVFYSGERFPFMSEVFDGAVCNQVLEHVFVPSQFLGEIHRILKPGGTLLLTVPFVWDEHEQPYDYARYSSFGLRNLLEASGFEMLEHRKINADIRVLFQLTNAYLYKILWTQWSAANLLICVTLMAPFNVLGLLLCKLLPSNPDLYLDQAVLVRKAAHG